MGRLLLAALAALAFPLRLIANDDAPPSGLLGHWLVEQIIEEGRIRDAAVPYRTEFTIVRDANGSRTDVSIAAAGNQNCAFESRGSRLIGQKNLPSGSAAVVLCTSDMDGGDADSRCRDSSCRDAVRHDDAFFHQLLLSGIDLEWHESGNDVVVRSPDGRQGVVLTRRKLQKPPPVNDLALDARFRALGAKVLAWRSRLDADRLDDVDDNAAHITDCDRPFADDSTAHVEIDGATYVYGSLDTGEDTFCLYMLQPERRLLSADEGRILIQAVQLRPYKSEPYIAP